MNISKFYIDESETIMTAIEAIEENNERSIFIVNKNKKLIGVLSQGDILKRLIEGVDFFTQVNKVCNKSFIYLRERDMKKALEIFKSKNLSIIPIIDNNFKLKDIITISQIYDYLQNKKRGEI